MSNSQENDGITTEMWFPSHQQLRYLPNSNYWNSLWLGTIWLLAMTPRALWWHLGHGQLFGRWFCNVVRNGLAGNLHSEDITDAEQQARLEAVQRIIKGYRSKR